MWWLLILGCTKPIESADVRDQLDSPTGTLSAQTLPHIVDDWFQVDTSYGAASGAFNLIDIVRASPLRQSAPVDLGPDIPQQDFIGGAVCAAQFIGQIATWDDCSRGDTCEVALTIRSCMLDDPQSRGKMRLALSESGGADLDRAAIEIEFDRFRTTDFGTVVTELDGSIELEIETPVDRMSESTTYIVNLHTKTMDLAERGLFGGGVLEEIDLRLGMRMSALNSDEAQVVTMEFLAWIDEDGDGVDDGTVVIGMDLANLEGGDLTTTSIFIRDSSGQWTCNYSLAVRENSDGVSRWVSEGTCTDPSGELVDFAGFGEE